MKKSSHLLVAAICLCTGAPAAAQDVAPARPNIVFLLADDMNRDSWGVYGSRDCKTPNIDRLASDGMRFDRAYCSVAMCAPFRQELYSGRSPWRTGTLANHSKSKPGTKSIAHYLQPLGYRVALLGKHHIGPKRCYPFEYLPFGGNKSVDRNPHIVREAGAFMDRCREQQRPFCLFIASNDSHAPFTTGDPSAYDAAKLTIPPYWIDTPELRRQLVAYYAEVTNFDALVGAMREQLEQRDLWGNTLFIVCSEQGSQFPFAKWTCYDNGLHTGLIAHWAGVIRPGSVAAELVSIADVAPTLVEVAGGAVPAKACDGRSLLPMLHGEEQVLHEHVFGAFTNCNIIGNRNRIYPIRSIRTEEFALLYNPNHDSQTSNVTIDGARRMLDNPSLDQPGVAASWVRLARREERFLDRVRQLHHRPEYELYSLREDPHELSNAAGKSKFAPVLARLKQALQAKLSELGDEQPVATERGLVKRRKR